MRQAKGKRISILIFLLGAVFLFSISMALHTLVVQGNRVGGGGSPPSSHTTTQAAIKEMHK